MAEPRSQSPNKTINLKVIGAKDLPITRFGKDPPNAFVKVAVGVFKARTGIVDRNRSPSWDQEFPIPNVQESAILGLHAYHHSRFNTKHHLGSVYITLQSLFELQRDRNQIELELTGKDGSATGGVLVISIKDQELRKAASVALNQSYKSGERLMAVLNGVDTSAPLVKIISSLGPFLELADRMALLHPYVNIAWQVTSLVIKIPRAQIDRDRGILELLGTMENLYSYVSSVDGIELNPVYEETVQKILTQTIECTFFIRKYTEHCFGSRALLQPLSEMANKIGQFQNTFAALEQRFLVTGTIQTVLVSNRVLGIVGDIKRYQMLDPVKMPMAGRPSCLQNTRLDVIKNITAWATDEDSTQRVFWISGLSGSGKSAVSTTIAEIFRELQHLGAFFFFNRFDERRDPNTLIRTLAYSLASFDVKLGEAVLASIDSAPSVADSPILFQFRKLLIEPLQTLGMDYSGAPIVIVIDALDECRSGPERSELLSVLSGEADKLPQFVRILITSRREPDIDLTFKSTPTILSYDLNLLSSSVSNDIRLFIESNMAKIRAAQPDLDLPVDWPGEDRISALTRASGDLFIWAATACAFIEHGHDPRARLDELTMMSALPSLPPLRALDALYTTALQHAGDWSDSAFRSDCVAILGLIVVAKVPLSSAAIDKLLELPRPSSHTIKQLRSLLHWQDVGPVRILHPSFQDFISDPARCDGQDWYVELAMHQGKIAARCFDVLEQALKKNIRNIANGEPFTPEPLPEAASYASSYWIEHVCSTPEINPNQLYSFLSQHLLHWMEAMSLQGLLRRAIKQLQQLSGRVKETKHEALLNLLRDAKRFMQLFADCCEEHPLLIYSTALSFCPANTTFYQLFRHERDLNVVGNIERWPPLLLRLHGHQEAIQAISVTRVGTKIVSGSWDRTIRIWDINSGSELLPPLMGHTGAVWAVACDGSTIVSGSQDGTIRLWDALTGAAIMPPLRSHGRPVVAVALTKDGSKFISGAEDKTIRVWDTKTGTEIIPPLCGHDGPVWAVALTSDGLKAASGSHDATVRVWDTTTGTEIVPTLRGHEGTVWSVAISADGSKVASGSEDRTIRVWDANTGDMLLPPLCGHEGPVWSVSFSSDGSRIASGSADYTVRVWDTKTGEEILQPLRGHDNRIWTVAFTDDGSKLVSGSQDKKIIVWDVSMDTGNLPPLRGESSPIVRYGHDLGAPARSFSGTVNVRRAQAVAESLKAHFDPVWSVAFTRDGSKKIISGSQSGTIRVWDANIGAETLPPLRGHDGPVRAVACTYDGSKIVSGSQDRTIRVWDANTGAETLPPFRGHTGLITSIALKNDGARIVSGSEDRTVRIWDADTGSEILPPLQGHEDIISSIALTQDGSKIASGSHDKTIRVWDATTGVEILPPLRGHEDQVCCVAFAFDGSRIASGSWDYKLRLWDASTGLEVLPPFGGHDGPIWSVAFSTDGSKIVSGSQDRSIRIWDATTGSQILPPLRGHEGPVSSVAFTRDGSRVVSGSHDRTIRVWSASTGAEVLPPLRAHSCLISSFAFNNDSSRVASGYQDGTIRIWDASAGVESLPPIQGHDGPISSIAFSNEGAKIASASEDRTISVWDANTGVETLLPLQGHDGPVWSVAFSHDGSRIVSGSHDRTLRVWDTSTGSETLPPLLGHTGPISSVAFSQDGSKIVSASWDRTICIWDTKTGGQILPPIRGHGGPVRSVAFNPDGSKIVSGSQDRTVRVWDSGTGVETLPPLQEHREPVDSVAFTRDGLHIVSRSWDGTTCVWDASTGSISQPSPAGEDEARAGLPHASRQPPISPDAMISLDKEGWVHHISTGQRMKLPTSLPFVDIKSMGSKLVGWTDTGRPVFTEFR